MDPDRERLRRDLQIERPAIARRDLVEARRAVGDDAGEDVEPPGGALGIASARAHRRAAPAIPAAAPGTPSRAAAWRPRPGTARSITRSRRRRRSRAWHRLAERQEAGAQLVGERVPGEGRGSRAGTARRPSGRGRRDPARLDRGAQRVVRQARRRRPASVVVASASAHAVHLSQPGGSPTPSVSTASALRARPRCRPTQRGLHRPRHRLRLIGARRRAARAPRPRARSRAHRHARAASATAGIHGKQPQAIGLVQPVVERGLEHVEAAGLQAGQQQRDALHVEHGVRARDRVRAAPRAPRPWRSSRSGTSTTQRTVAGHRQRDRGHSAVARVRTTR